MEVLPQPSVAVVLVRAIAIHDAAAGRLVLSRDPFGVKPLYYTETADAFAFASEPQALIRAGLCDARENAE